MIHADVVIAASGTPQQASKLTNPGLPTISMGGVTYPAGSAATGCKQLNIENPAGSTGNLYVGGPAMNKTTLVGVSAVIVPGSFRTYGQYGGDVLLDDFWLDTDTSGNKALLGIL